MTTRGPAPFSPVYHGMQFRAAPPEQPARQITALFATPGTSKRNKDLRRCRDAGIYAYPSWTSVRRESGNDNVQLPRKHYARRATSVRLYSIRVTHAECVLIKFFPQERNPTRLCDAGSEALFLRDSRCESSRDNVFCIDKRQEEKEIRAFVKFIGNNRES